MNEDQYVTVQCRIVFSFSFTELSDLEYCNVKVRGTFDHDREIMLGPRSNLAAKQNTHTSFGANSNTGYHVITPFHLANRK